MGDTDSRQHDVPKKIAIASVPIALVGLLSALPATISTGAGNGEMRAASTGADITQRAIAPQATGDIASPKLETASDDENAPVIDVSSLTVSPTSGTKENPPRFTVRATDATGVSFIRIQLKHIATGRTADVQRFDRTGDIKDGVWTGSMTVTDDTPSGK